MAEEVKKGVFYKGILGDTQASIEAIQRFIDENSKRPVPASQDGKLPVDSINRILESLSDEETNSDIQKVIDSL
jgi:hypothetical protein